jgi:hypothetical protein
LAKAMGLTKANYKILCACGCHQYTDKFNKWGYERRFITGHQSKGELNIRWKGGQFLKSSGYRMILKPEHHFATQLGYVPEHRLAWEEYHRAILLPWADCHHKNGNKLDNRIENLEATTKSNHAKLHVNKYRNQVMFKRICIICKFNKTRYRKWSNSYEWYFLNKDRSKPVCGNCYHMLKYRPTSNRKRKEQYASLSK